MKNGDICRDDMTTLLQRKVGSILAWVAGVLVSALLDLCARKLWNCFSHKVDSCLEGAQNWAKNAKCRVFLFLGVFYTIMTGISGALAVIAERYGEGKIWPRNSSSALIAVFVGVGAGLLGSALLLISPHLKKINLRNIACCDSACNQISRCIGAVRSMASSACNRLMCKRSVARDQDQAHDLGLEVNMIDSDDDDVEIGRRNLPLAAGVGLGIDSSPDHSSEVAVQDGQSPGSFTLLAENEVKSAGYSEQFSSSQRSDSWAGRMEQQRSVVIQQVGNGVA